MLAVALYLDGKYLLIWFAVFFALVVVAVVWFTIWLVRRARLRIGNRAYFLIPVPFASLLLAGLAFSFSQAPNNGPPSEMPPSKLAVLIKRLPDYASFGYSGLAFYKSRLYVTTNLGLLEIEDGRIDKLYQFQKNDSVVSGPWFDEANQLLWVMDDHKNQLLNYDGTSWRRVDLPNPQKGYYSRGDVLEGLRPAGNGNGFWLQAAGNVWRWNPANNSWIFETQPTSDSISEDPRVIIGILPIGAKLLFIVRHERLEFLIKDSQDFASDTVVTASDDWKAIPNVTGTNFFAENWVANGNSGYICTRTGSMLKVTEQAITKMDAPGKCEALATGDASVLLGSFRGLGIYEYGEAWRLRATHPYPTGDGEYWAHLSVAGKKLAFAINGKPVIDKGRSSGSAMKFTRNAPTSLWYAQGTEFKLVDLP